MATLDEHEVTAIYRTHHLLKSILRERKIPGEGELDQCIADLGAILDNFRRENVPSPLAGLASQPPPLLALEHRHGYHRRASVPDCPVCKTEG